jgi:hypothetical protein
MVQSNKRRADKKDRADEEDHQEYKGTEILAD